MLLSAFCYSTFSGSTLFQTAISTCRFPSEKIAPSYSSFEEYLFLFTLLNLDYAEYEYDIIPGTERIIDQIVTVSFSRKASTLRYVNIQKTRKTRIAYSALAEYAKKENRNGFTYTNPTIEALKVEAFHILSKVDTELKKMNATLISALDTNGGSDVALEQFINSVNYKQLLQNDKYLRVKEH